MLSRSIRLLWTILLLLFLFLLTGCSEGSDGGVIEYTGDDDSKDAPRYFIFCDNYPYPGKKEDCTITDKDPEITHTIYIYVINNGENWKDNEFRNVKLTYYDIIRGESTVYEGDDIHYYISDKHENSYAYVNVIYPEDARGYFTIEGEILQGGTHWYFKQEDSNLFNYGDPPAPLDRNDVIYEKEIVNQPTQVDLLRR